MNRLPIIFDCDPGHDDAIALILALAHEELDIKGICCVTGNNTLPHTLENALKICGVLELDIPVVAGISTPFVEENRPALVFHGNSGMDGPILPFPKKKPLEINVCDFYKKVIDECGEITIVGVGPFTNIATFMLSYPEYVSKIKRIAVMGGSASSGNQTATAEFNVWHDPEAAKIVFSSGVPILMAGLDVTVKAGLVEEELENFKSMGTVAGKFIWDLMEFYKVWRFRKKVSVYSMHDSVPVAWLIRPEIFKTKKCYVDVDLYGVHTRGCTVTDVLNIKGLKPNVDVCFDVNRVEFANMLIDAARNLK